MNSTNTPVIPGDHLRGTEDIAGFVTEVTGIPHTKRQINYAHEKRTLPIWKRGAWLESRRSTIVQYFAALEADALANSRG